MKYQKFTVIKCNTYWWNLCIYILFHAKFKYLPNGYFSVKNLKVKC